VVNRVLPCPRFIKSHLVFSKIEEFDSYLLNDSDLIKGYKRLLETDRHLVVPYK